MPGETEDQHAVISQYLSAPSRLQEAVTSLSESQLDLALAPGSWTIRQIAHHIVDGDWLWTVAIKAALGQNETPFGFQWYWNVEQDDWARRWNYAGRALEPSLALFAANRSHVEQLLQSIPGAWQRSMLVQWPAGQGQVTVAGIVDMQARHALAHIDEILSIRRAHGY